MKDEKFKKKNNGVDPRMIMNLLSSGSTVAWISQHFSLPYTVVLQVKKKWKKENNKTLEEINAMKIEDKLNYVFGND